MSSVDARTATELPLPVFRRGKVRDTYQLPDTRLLLMVASDRISAFDVVLPTPIPDKGRLLTSLSAFWFEQLGGLIPNHLVSTDVPSILGLSPSDAVDLAGRSLVVRRAERIDVECVVRGYLAGSAWDEYQRLGTVAGEAMPPGLPRAARLPAPLFTPAVKYDDDHDVTISPDRLADMVGQELAGRLEEVSRDIYGVASTYMAERGVILADTKFEFGWIEGELTLIDEALTPDSSRFWDAEAWSPDTEPASFDKQFVRNWLLTTDWNKESPGPALPPTVVSGTVERYQEAHRRITGMPLEEMGEPLVGTGERVGSTPAAEVLLHWKVDILVLPKAGVNDPQGEAIRGGLRSLGFVGVEEVRAGKLIRLRLRAASAEAAEAEATEMSQRLLANPVIETFLIEVSADGETVG